MEEFLSHTTEKLKSGKYTSVAIVIGNISCDLDSAVCSLVYALCLHWRHSGLESRVCTRQYRQGADSDHVFIPILNVKREDFEVKTEVSFCLREQHLTAQNLIFRDDFDFKQLSESSDAAVTLVDHHILADEDQFLQESVREIIDHRPRDAKNWKHGEEVKANIELVGSCSTLVCECIRSGGDGEEFFKLYPACAHLLYDAIILDTVNFSSEVKKGTPQDLEQVLYLEKCLAVQDSDGHRATRLKQLVAARSDVSRLSAKQLLRKDVKIIASVLVPSFPMLVQEVLARDDVGPALEAEARAQRCSLAVLLGMRLAEGHVQRDLAVWSTERPNNARTLATLLEQSATPPLQLTKVPTSLPACLYYRQDNLAASRKQVMPLISQYIEGSCSEDA